MYGSNIPNSLGGTRRSLSGTAYHRFVASSLAKSGMPDITHHSCSDNWLAQLSLTNMHNGGLSTIIANFLTVGATMGNISQQLPCHDDYT